MNRTGNRNLTAFRCLETLATVAGGVSKIRVQRQIITHSTTLNVIFRVGKPHTAEGTLRSFWKTNKKCSSSMIATKRKRRDIENLKRCRPSEIPRHRVWCGKRDVWGSWRRGKDDESKLFYQTEGEVNFSSRGATWRLVAGLGRARTIVRV